MSEAEEVTVSCPHCGALVRVSLNRFDSMCFDQRSWNRRWTDMVSVQSVGGYSWQPQMHEWLVSRCRQCLRYYPCKKEYEFYPGSHSTEFRSRHLPTMVGPLSAQEVYEAIGDGAFNDSEDESEVRLLAWKLANDESRLGVQKKYSQPIIDARQSCTEHPADATDWELAIQSLYEWWYGTLANIDLRDTYRNMFLQIVGSPDESVSFNQGVVTDIVESATPFVTAPSSATREYEIDVSERQQMRDRARERIWEQVSNEPYAEVPWFHENLERFIGLLSADDYCRLAIKRHNMGFVSEEGKKEVIIRSRLLQAEALRQLGRFADALQLLDDPSNFCSSFVHYRHTAKVIYELAGKGYRFLWFTTGDEDYSAAELVHVVNVSRKQEKEQKRKRELENAARTKELEFVRRAMLYQHEFDKRGCVAGKTDEQLIQENIACPRCTYRSYWDGERCGRCDSTVFKTGRPCSWELESIHRELIESGQVRG